MERVREGNKIIDFGFQNSPHREYVNNKTLPEEWFVRDAFKSCFSMCAMKMTEKATAILVPIAIPCVYRLCLSLNLNEFSVRISRIKSPKN